VRVLPSSPEEGSGGIRDFAFSPNGEWFGSAGTEKVWLSPHDGGKRILLGSYSSQGNYLSLAFDTDDVLVADQDGHFRWLSVPEGKELRRVQGNRGRLWLPRGDGYFSWSLSEEDGRLLIYWWPYGDGASRLIGSMADIWAADIDTTGSWIAYSREESLYLRSLEDWSQPPQRLADHDEKVTEIAFHPSGQRIAAKDESGELRIWSTTGSGAKPLRFFQAGGMKGFRFDPSGRWLAGHSDSDGRPTVQLWDLTAPQSAVPLTLSRTDDVFANYLSFHPNKPWLVTSNTNSAGFWPLTPRYPWTLVAHKGRVFDVDFTPDGKWLVSAAGDGVRAWPLQGQNDGAPQILFESALIVFVTLDIHPSGEHLAVTSWEGTVLVVPLAGGPIREMPGAWTNARGMVVDFSPDGRLLAAVPIYVDGPTDEMVIRVWDLVSGGVQTLGPVPGQSAYLGFDDDRRLRWSGKDLSAGSGGERVFDLEDGSIEIVSEEGSEWFRVVSRSGSFMITRDSTSTESEMPGLVWRSLETGDSRRITSHGDAWTMALDPSDRWLVTGGYSDGLVRVGPVSGEEPHLLYGHSGLVRSVAVSPDSRWIASGGDDGTVRLWPMPDLDKPPFHTRPNDELLETLHSLTNLRVVEDPESSTGWKVEAGPFPGWKEVPKW